MRLPEDLEGVDGLIIPGGESTTMLIVAKRLGLFEPLKHTVNQGLPTLGTCAGMIMLATRIDDGIDGQIGFGTLDIEVRRNAYGRQLDSFESPVEVKGLDSPFPGVFIRAPVIEDTGMAEVIARHRGRPVGVRQGAAMALSFHPELSHDLRLHRMFLEMVNQHRRWPAGGAHVGAHAHSGDRPAKTGEGAGERLS